MNLTRINSSNDQIFPRNYSNSSVKAQSDESWLGAIHLTVITTSVIANIIFLFAYQRCPDRSSSFSLYLLCMSIGDLSQALTAGLSNVILSFCAGWPLGPVLCTLRLYLAWIISGFLLHLHLALCLNRLFAVTFPLRYRLLEHRKVTWWVLLGIVVYCHAWILPGIVPDALYWQPKGGLTCNLHIKAMPTWSLLVNLVFFPLPMVGIVLVYPMVLYKVWKHRHSVQQEQTVNLRKHQRTHVIDKGKYSLPHPDSHMTEFLTHKVQNTKWAAGFSWALFHCFKQWCTGDQARMGNFALFPSFTHQQIY